MRSIWKVRVRGLYHCDKKKVHRWYAKCLIEAESSEQAMDLGKQFVESGCPAKWKWLAFDALEACRLKVPVLTESL